MKSKQMFSLSVRISFRMGPASGSKTSSLALLLDLHKDQAAAKTALREGIDWLCGKTPGGLGRQVSMGVLLILQAVMDAAGEDGAIEHVMSGINPQGCEVYSFKQPSAEELDDQSSAVHGAPATRARAHRHLHSS